MELKVMKCKPISHFIKLYIDISGFISSNNTFIFLQSEFGHSVDQEGLGLGTIILIFHCIGVLHLHSD